MIKRIVTFLTAWVCLLGLCACGQSTSGQADSAGQATWEEQYDLGLRYLSDGDYEEAIIAFTAAIEIDSKRTPAYVGRGDAYVGYAQTLAEDGVLNDGALEAYENAVKDYRTAIRQDKTDASVYQKAAEVYVILGDMDSAAELIEKGLSATEDQSLQDFLDKLAGVVPADSLAEGSAERQALEDFLLRFTDCYGGYDCETAAVPTTALEMMLTTENGSYACYDDTLYPGEMRERVFDSDPLGKFYPEGPYEKVNAARLDWILEHIFNCSKADIQKMKEPILAGQNEKVYYLDGYYYFWVGGIGGPYIEISITKIEPVGMRYYVEYCFDAYWGDDYPDQSSYSAMVSLKEIDGEKYWSLYYNRYNQESNSGGTPDVGGAPYSGETPDAGSSPMEAYIGRWVGGDTEMDITGVDADHISCEVAFYRLCVFDFIGTSDLSGRVALYDEESGVCGEFVLVDDQITMTLEDVPNFYFDDSLSEFLGYTQFVFYRE